MKKNCEDHQNETLNRINELENLVENHTRTERHLEDRNDLSPHESISAAKEKQRKREHSINNLENKIVSNGRDSTNEKENLEKRLEYSEGYIKHNSDHMNKKDLHNLENKIENRKDTLNRI
jgi:uncharacterized protein YlxW (UPF0749 family)